MKADNSEAAAAVEHLQRAGQALLDLSQLIVDEHAQRLKSPCRGILARLARFHGACHERGEL